MNSKWIDGRAPTLVRFNRYPGVADAVYDDNTHRLTRKIYRKNVRSRPRTGNTRASTSPVLNRSATD